MKSPRELLLKRHEATTPKLDALRAAALPVRSQLSTFNSQHVPWWCEWLWPCPQAWAALLAVWVLLLAVNFSNRDRSATSTASANAVPVMYYAWHEQQQLLAELFPPEPVAPPRPRVQPAPAVPPAPRSELRPAARREEELA